MKLEDVMRKVGELEVSACISGMHGAATCTHAQAIADVRAAILKYGRAQRERAAKVCDSMQPGGHHPLQSLDAAQAAIRSLPDEEA